MRAIWLAAYAAWEGYVAIQKQADASDDVAGANLERFEAHIEAVARAIS